MRQQISISRGSRAVWAAARVAAKDDEIPISELVTQALREFLDRRGRRLRAGDGQ